MSLTVSHCCWLHQTVSPVTRKSYITLNLSYGYWLSLTVSLDQKSCCMSLKVSPSILEFLNVSQYLPLLLAVTRSLSSTKELLNVFCYLSLLLVVSLYLFWSCGLAECLSLSPTFAGCLDAPSNKERNLDIASKIMETVSYMQQFHGAGKESERETAAMRE